MTATFLDAVFKPFFRTVLDTGQQLTINQTNFLTDGFLQIIQRTGFVSVNTRFQIPPKKKSHWKIGRARGPRHISETGNEVPGKHVSNNSHWLICSVRCGQLATEVANPEEKNADHFSTPPWPNHWVLPIQKMSGSRGSSCTYYLRENVPVSAPIWDNTMQRSGDMSKWNQKTTI